jgi:hypothetical protein
MLEKEKHDSNGYLQFDEIKKEKQNYQKRV